MSSVVEIMLSLQEVICDVYFVDSLNYDIIIDRGKLRKIGIATAAVRLCNLRFGA
jgi:hypothetical protein